MSITTPLNTEEAQGNKGDLVLIVGMHRSGTSAVGKLLKHLGFHMGSHLLKKISTINDNGFWEDETIVSINEEIFSRLGSSWYSLQTLPDDWWQSESLDDLYEKAERWFNTEFNYQSPSAIKDPRFCRLLPFWLKFFAAQGVTPRVVIVYRHPYAVAASLRKRDGFSYNISVLLWLINTLDALKHAPESGLSLVQYEKLTRSPERATENLLNDGLRGIASLKRLRFRRTANAAISPLKNHHRDVDLSAEQILLGNMACDFYQALDKGFSEPAHKCIDQYKSQLDSLFESNKELMPVLQEQINLYVKTNQRLSVIGDEHTEALEMIDEKDSRIKGNKDYIEKCHARIKKQDKQFKKNVTYIKKCESRIRDQDEIIHQLKANNSLWSVFYALKNRVKSVLGRS